MRGDGKKYTMLRVTNRHKDELSNNNKAQRLEDVTIGVSSDVEYAEIDHTQSNRILHFLHRDN